MCWRITATWMARMRRELVDVLDDGVGCGRAVGFSGLFAYPDHCGPLERPRAGGTTGR